MNPTHIVQLVLVNTLAWLVIQLGFAWLGTRMPARFFRHRGGWFRIRRFEADGRFYETGFQVRVWKDLMPDGAKLFKRGFPKGRLVGKDADYLGNFVLETRRGEAVHLAVILASAFFFLWNPPEIAIWMVVYALVANLPCMVIQRYNRGRMERILNQAAARRRG